MKKNKENEKVNKLKEYYNKYKEAKKDPVKKAGMKLLGYFIFFLILVLIANISSEFDKKNTQTSTKTTTTKIIDSYVEKQNDLLTNKYNINYVITYNDKEYKINGILENNVLNGYLELDNEIKKIVIKDNLIYENNVVLEQEFNLDNLNINNIITTIKQTASKEWITDGGLIKNVVLVSCAIINKILFGFKSDTYFYSIVNTCKITRDKLKSYKVPGSYNSVEIGIHPGLPEIDKQKRDDVFDDNILKDYRQKELETLLDKEVAQEFI